ncbi:MAG: glycosyltransferase, partial [Clostridia bacterium]|nr:glycosyltransferase [Clostridia bacterium]
KPAYEISPEVKIEYLTDVRPNKEAFYAAVKSKNPFKILKEGLYSVKVLRLKKTSLVKRIKQIEDGIVISTRNEHSTLLSKYGKKDVLKIAQLHHDHCFEQKLLSDIKNSYYNIDYFTLLTDQLTEEVSGMMEETNKRTKCITVENFLPKEDVEIELDNKQKTVVAVGRLHTVKGFDRLLEIWKEAVDRQPDWKLLIVGDGDERDRLSELANKLEIADSVTFTGALSHDKVLETMRDSSIYAMTSHTEGFPFVLIEAMSSGLPAVAFDVRVGPRAIIQDGKNGTLVDDGDKKAYADALCRLMTDGTLCNEYAKNALERANDFTEEKIVQKWIALFEREV